MAGVVDTEVEGVGTEGGRTGNGGVAPSCDRARLTVDCASLALNRAIDTVAVEHLVADEGGRVVRGNAHVFLVERLLVGAAGFDEIKVCRLVHCLAFVASWEFLLQLGEKALVQGVFKGDFMKAELLRVAALDLIDKLLEERIRAARSREDFEVTAPRNTRIGDGVELARIGMKRELIEHTVTALTRLSVRVGGHRVDAKTVAHLQHIRRRAFSVNDTLAEVLGASVENAGEAFAVFQEKPRLNLVARRYPRVELRGFKSLAADKPVSRRPSPADLTRFDREFQARSILNPPFLIRKEQGVFRLYFRVSHFSR